MGLFDRFKKKTVHEENETKSENEFDRDIKNLLNRDDIQCRTDVCEAEYEKALSLLKTQIAENTHRAYDLMGNLAAQFEYIPAILWMGDFSENAMQDLCQAAFWYKKAADLGSGSGARCYADMLMTGNGVTQNSKLALQYYSEAADKGVPEAAFVLGEFLRNTGDNANALKAYQQALNGGYEPAKIRIDQLKSR